jgi:uncharacterized protein YndB with AHSA1/START domain
MTAATILLEFRSEFSAPPARVFAALTEADHLARWLCDDADSEAMVGGRVTLRWSGPDASSQPFEGHWVVFQRPLSCAFDGGHSGYPDGNAGRVGFELAAGGPGTVLITRHRMPQRPDYEPIAERYRGAWPRALARLAALLEAAPVEPVR